ncbi:MAG: tRNA (guanosine(37)-N1)-methyltransferase TrmD [Victivallaceae bacterium]|nr:tRNA (guanosine(37)-N1)-methyltransferase TrmD [Victivallaceae bacterium]
MRIDVLTLFPGLFPGPLGDSVIGRAVRNGIVEINAVNVRDWAVDKRGTVDDKPYGGGPGMLMMVDPLVGAIRAKKRRDSLVVLTSPRGELFNQEIANELAEEKHLIIVCGHYEGIDQRVIDSEVDREISIGDYVLSNGVLPAMVICDTVARLLPGALGDDESSRHESHMDGLLEYPQYTRSVTREGDGVPEVLLSGDHSKIEKFRRKEMERLTRCRRPDLWEKYLIEGRMKGQRR